MDPLIDSIPDSLFSELAANSAQISDVSELFREAEEILVRKGLADYNDTFFEQKSIRTSEEFKEVGNKFCKSGNLWGSLLNYNGW
jgi:hypothetical protein